MERRESRPSFVSIEEAVAVAEEMGVLTRLPEFKLKVPHYIIRSEPYRIAGQLFFRNHQELQGKPEDYITSFRFELEDDAVANLIANPISKNIDLQISALPESWDGGLAAAYLRYKEMVDNPEVERYWEKKNQLINIDPFTWHVPTFEEMDEANQEFNEIYETYPQIESLNQTLLFKPVNSVYGARMTHFELKRDNLIFTPYTVSIPTAPWPLDSLSGNMMTGVLSKSVEEGGNQDKELWENFLKTQGKNLPLQARLAISKSLQELK